MIEPHGCVWGYCPVPLVCSGGPWLLPISVATHGKLKELAEGIYLSHHTEGTAGPRGTVTVKGKEGGCAISPSH